MHVDSIVSSSSASLVAASLIIACNDAIFFVNVALPDKPSNPADQPPCQYPTSLPLPLVFLMVFRHFGTVILFSIFLLRCLFFSERFFVHFVRLFFFYLFYNWSAPKSLLLVFLFFDVALFVLLLDHYYFFTSILVYLPLDCPLFLPKIPSDHPRPPLLTFCFFWPLTYYIVKHSVLTHLFLFLSCFWFPPYKCTHPHTY